MSDTQAGFEAASFTIKTGKRAGQVVKTNFNPASLQFTVTNTLKEGSGGKTKQHVSESAAKLTMDLVFDTTDTGEDVRTYTEPVVQFMEPDSQSSPVPPTVLFKWGTFEFQGMAESFQQTMDFFAPNGVPLRAVVALGLVNQDKVFAETTKGKFGTSGSLAGGGGLQSAVDLPGESGQSAADAASKAGAPGAGRAVAAANGLESVRASASSAITLANDAIAAPPKGLAQSGDASDAQARPAHGQDSAGTPASQGAFDGLRTLSSSPQYQLNLDRLRPSVDSVSAATDAGASFQVGGIAVISAPSTLRADVGTNASLRDLLDFED